ncbi:MAG: ATP-binding cassette domain-containing protein [Flavobacteriales bacterium]|nr:putative ABC transporter ATP-binding protein [Flavobacteriales bacterium]MCC6576254.1 ATP-binding cassette domain-containing protein [Flavobacteriales bacterium]NUQ15542.1 ATP-binding cassette domain-containing protein [Flavobacteriales bacterium]
MASRRDRDRYNDAKPAKLDRTTLRKALRIFRYLRPHRWAFAAGMVFLLGTSTLSLVFPGLMGRLIDSTKGPSSFSAPLLDLTDTDSIFLLLLLTFAVQAVLGYFRIFLFAHVTEHMLADLRRDTYAHLLRQPMTFFARRRVGEINSRLSADTALLQDTFTTTLAELVRQVIIIAAGLVLLARLSPELTLTMLASVPAVVLVAVLFGRFIGRLSRQVQDRIADTNVIVDETLQGIQSVKAFANEAWEIARYGRSVLAARALAMRGARWRGALVSFIILCMFGAIVLVVWRGVNLQREGLLSNGELVTFILYSVFVGASIGSVPEQVNTVLKAIGATERLMDLHDEVGEPVSLAPRKERTALRGRIAFEGVSFHYDTRPDVPVLRNVSFTAEPGQRIALVGPSGAGKSTIAALVLRFYDPVQGMVRIDDRDARTYDLTALRDRMAIVPQEVLLFGGSIRENIAYGRPDATDAEVEAAARRANAHGFIAAFPEGYATVVGERGIQLSGGQRQRIAIARALLKDPAILILDEATSALDSESERLVQEALEELMKGRTSLVIAHRLSTIRDADRILVLDKGVIAESGTHGELIADADGLYHSLNRLQMES